MPNALVISKDSAAKLLLTPFALPAEHPGIATGFNGDFRDPARHAKRGPEEFSQPGSLAKEHWHRENPSPPLS